jgi:hypothetical protein
MWLPTCGEQLWLGGPRIAKKMKPPNPRPSPPPSKAALDAEKMASESHAGKGSFFQFLTRFLYGEVASQSLKNTFWGETLYFVRKSSWCISESPGVFFIEQAQKQKIIDGPKPAPWRYRRFILLAMQGPPSHLRRSDTDTALPLIFISQ